MNYIPTTLKSIKDEKLYNLLDIRRKKIISKVNKLGWENIDDHDENFVYDIESDKLYAIDFTDWQKI